MSSRNEILKRITANKPTLTDLPTIALNEVIRYDDNIAQFKKVLESIGGVLIELNDAQEIEAEIEAEKIAGNRVVNVLHPTEAEQAALHTLTAPELALVHKAYINGTLGVAESGAVWVDEQQMVNRLLPFICQHLVLVVPKTAIATTMHHAYEQINAAKEGFGVFIAGPSKTADIEQSLVIGAHGARSLVVYLV